MKKMILKTVIVVSLTLTAVAYAGGPNYEPTKSDGSYVFLRGAATFMTTNTGSVTTGVTQSSDLPAYGGKAGVGVMWPVASTWFLGGEFDGAYLGTIDDTNSSTPLRITHRTNYTLYDLLGVITHAVANRITVNFRLGAGVQTSEDKNYTSANQTLVTSTASTNLMIGGGFAFEVYHPVWFTADYDYLNTNDATNIFELGLEWQMPA